MPSGSESVDVRSWDLDVILRNVCELNKLVSENERTVEYVGENRDRRECCKIEHYQFDSYFFFNL